MTAAGFCGGQLDRYLVERLLGSGGCGSVYRARHVRTDGLVALKVLKQEMMADGSMLDRFMREAKMAAAVGDDRIVRVLDAEITPGRVAFIAMELLEGDDLKQLHLREGPLHPARLIGLVCQVLEGLAAAHAKQIVHRDLKPANVFVLRRADLYGNHTEVAKLLDFGIGKMHGEPGSKPLTVIGTTLGTPAYMAHEQFVDARDVDARTDVYSVAVMLYELLSGKKPFDAESFAGVMSKIRIGDYPPLRNAAPGLPVPLVAVVEKGMDRKRERRWQSAREFAVALEGTLRLLGTPAPLTAWVNPESVFAPTDKPTRTQ